MDKPKQKPKGNRPKKAHSTAYKIITTTDKELRKVLKALLP